MPIKNHRVFKMSEQQIRKNGHIKIESILDIPTRSFDKILFINIRGLPVVKRISWRPQYCYDPLVLFPVYERSSRRDAPPPVKDKNL